MNTTVKTGLICAAGAAAIGAAATGIITAVRVAKKKKAINYKEKIEAYKEAEKTNTVTEEIKAEAEEAKAEVKKVIKEEIVDNAKALVAVAVVGFSLGYIGGYMYEVGYARGNFRGKFEGVAVSAGVNEYCLENGLMSNKDLKPGYFTANAKAFVKDYSYVKNSACTVEAVDGFEDVVDELVDQAKEICNKAKEMCEEAVA